jgi:EAL domain-containing protein (putative c-di-GMP-specific phosphodiesterase class I)
MTAARRPAPVCLNPRLRGLGSFTAGLGEARVFLFRRFKWLAAVIGVLVAAGPVLVFTSWLQRQGDDEVSIAASWTVANADRQINKAVAALEALAAKGIDGCRAGQVDVLQQHLFGSGPVKELSVTGPNGQTLCTDRGQTFPRREVLASMATDAPGLTLDAVRMAGTAEPVLRVRRGSAGKPGLAAILPVNFLLPQVSPDGGPFQGYARIALADGTAIGTVGTPAEAADPEGLVATRSRSARYGFTVTAAMVRDGVFATYEDLRRIGVVVTGVLALVILLVALVLPWREQRNNPYFDIERAIAADEFVPYYQPIVDIKSGRLIGAEVLVRWRKRDGSLVMPGAFIPFLESTDLILDLTRSLMRQVCHEVGDAFEQRPQLYLAFNIAPRHLTEETLLTDIATIFDGASIRLSQLVLELTERYQIENLTSTRCLIAALQGQGCRIAIDDVGTGHSGLSYMLKLGVDIIKIDKMFVEAIRTERHSQAIVDTLVDLAANLRMQIIAEGVENFEQVVYLRDHGISSAQGYVFAPPLPATAFLQLVEAIEPAAEVAAAEPAAEWPAQSAAA